MVRLGLRTAAVCLALLWIAWQPASAQVAWDPAAVVRAYVAALNAQDVPAAIALFDEFGSATDSHHHNFSGADGLTQFLRAPFSPQNSFVAGDDPGDPFALLAGHALSPVALAWT